MMKIDNMSEPKEFVVSKDSEFARVGRKGKSDLTVMVAAAPTPVRKLQLVHLGASGVLSVEWPVTINDAQPGNLVLADSSFVFFK